MTDLNRADIYEMAKAAGLELDEARAETIASRLSGILTELDQIPTEKLMSVDPAQSFSVNEESDNG